MKPDALHRSQRLRFAETLYRYHRQDQEESDDDDVQQVDRLGGWAIKIEKIGRRGLSLSFVHIEQG